MLTQERGRDNDLNVLQKRKMEERKKKVAVQLMLRSKTHHLDLLLVHYFCQFEHHEKQKRKAS